MVDCLKESQFTFLKLLLQPPFSLNVSAVIFCSANYFLALLLLFFFFKSEVDNLLIILFYLTLTHQGYDVDQVIGRSVACGACVVESNSVSTTSRNRSRKIFLRELEYS